MHCLQSHDARPRLYIFACFYNEAELIGPSIRQLELLEAHEIHVADGCFDRRWNEHSSDNTLTRLTQFAGDTDNVVVHRVVRKSQFRHIFDWLTWVCSRPLSRKWLFVPAIIKILFTDNYRVNQAATFNYMLDRCGATPDQDWVMTYDADEFFDESAIRAFKNLGEFADVVPIKERTFVGDLQSEALDYATTELRYWNVPHKFVPGMRFLPPRLIVWPPRSQGKGRFGFRLRSAPTHGADPVGTLFHYKGFSPKRADLSYSLGDRKPPSEARLVTTQVQAEHPHIAQSAFK